jgi:hypothetical protein
LTFDETKAEQYGDIIRYNSLKRMFNAFKKFSKNHRTARRFFQRVYSNADIRAKRCCFDQWNRAVKAEIKDESGEKQANLTKMVQ